VKKPKNILETLREACLLVGFFQFRVWTMAYLPAGNVVGVWFDTALGWVSPEKEG
jgi:hypothetical protein